MLFFENFLDRFRNSYQFKNWIFHRFLNFTTKIRYTNKKYWKASVLIFPFYYYLEIHTYIHTYVRTYIHTYIHISRKNTFKFLCVCLFAVVTHECENFCSMYLTIMQKQRMLLLFFVFPRNARQIILHDNQQIVGVMDF